MSTYSGKRIYPLQVEPEDITIEDIAHGLANTCRYGGQAISFYSVAEHNLRGSNRATTLALAQEFLLHNAAKAYVGDVITSMVEICRDYREVRESMQAAINAKFGLPQQRSPACKELSARMLITEARVMFTHQDYKYWSGQAHAEPFANEWVRTRDKPMIMSDGHSPYDGDNGAEIWDMDFMPQRQARRLFLEQYKLLFEEIRQ